MSSGTLTEPSFEVGIEGWGYIKPTYDQVIETLYDFKAIARFHQSFLRSSFSGLDGFIGFDTIAKKLNDRCGMTLWAVVAVFDTAEHAVMAKLSWP